MVDVHDARRICRSFYHEKLKSQNRREFADLFLERVYLQFISRYPKTWETGGEIERQKKRKVPGWAGLGWADRTGSVRCPRPSAARWDTNHMHIYIHTYIRCALRARWIADHLDLNEKDVITQRRLENGNKSAKAMECSQDGRLGLCWVVHVGLARISLFHDRSPDHDDQALNHTGPAHGDTDTDAFCLPLRSGIPDLIYMNNRHTTIDSF
ncbi:hypothetical protein V8F33_011046 [Rhypophila sp. PSN 637]